MKKYLVLPPIPRKTEERYYLYFAMCQLICEIPYGKVSTENDLYDLLKKLYGINRLEIEYPKATTRTEMDEGYPYWRLLSERGHLHGAKVTQKKLLEREGHTVLEPKPEMDMYIVKDYKSRLYRFENLQIHILKTDEDYMRDAIESVYNSLNSNDE